MKVKRNTLLLIACLVWSTAGVNILHIGMKDKKAYRQNQWLSGRKTFFYEVL